MSNNPFYNSIFAQNVDMLKEVLNINNSLGMNIINNKNNKKHTLNMTIRTMMSNGLNRFNFDIIKELISHGALPSYIEYSTLCTSIEYSIRNLVVSDDIKKTDK